MGCDDRAQSRRVSLEPEVRPARARLKRPHLVTDGDPPFKDLLALPERFDFFQLAALQTDGTRTIPAGVADFNMVHA